MKLWRRTWRVTVGTLQSSDLDIEFKIKRSLHGKKPNTCELNVFNLSEDHRAEAQASRKALVRVEAGYVEGMAQIFQGDARKVETARDGGDWVTKVTAGDGEWSIRTARGAQSFGPETKLEQVVQYLANTMNVGLGNVQQTIRDRGLDKVGALFPAGTVVRGRISSELDALVRSAGLEWSVQDGVLQLLPQGGALSRQAVRLSPDTGLIGSAEKGKHGTVKATALMMPELVPGRLVHLESAMVTGDFRIDVAEYSGQSSGDDWNVELTMREAS